MTTTETPVIPLATALNLADAALESGTNLADALALLAAAVRADHEPVEAHLRERRCRHCGWAITQDHPRRWVITPRAGMTPTAALHCNFGPGGHHIPAAESPR